MKKRRRRRDKAGTGSAKPATMNKMFYTVDEAAVILDVNVSWIYERTRKGAIQHRKLGKFVRFTHEDLKAISEAAARGTLQ